MYPTVPFVRKFLIRKIENLLQSSNWFISMISYQVNALVNDVRTSSGNRPNGDMCLNLPPVVVGIFFTSDTAYFLRCVM